MRVAVPLFHFMKEESGLREIEEVAQHFTTSQP